MYTFAYEENGPVTVSELTDLYKSVSWSAYYEDRDIMQRLLVGSLYYLTVRYDGQLIGLIRTVGDGCYILYIQDILVHPDWHRRGIGTTLIRQTLETFKDMKQIILTTDQTDKTRSFYESVGFVEMSEAQAVSFIKLSSH
ncbi:acetyltransferase, GNAT family [Alkalibacterium sp. AK22]|uniref:GNAT family N-acetyltransferase n=1 Tax=Alkalibacterium sp. AK22 TaxID=1229520 RepID=UPI00044C9ECF|nr:GNAT family N-acetyltransferase [Alkalibacterium sp. AK22]EXJ23427.1 acetyltransferase, GNAT family [Alkalibacterium sp. AK22]